MKSKYKITGYYANTKKKFPTMHTDNFGQAMSVNLWRGKIWKLQPDGKYKLLLSVWN